MAKEKGAKKAKSKRKQLSQKQKKAKAKKDKSLELADETLEINNGFAKSLKGRIIVKNKLKQKKDDKPKSTKPGFLAWLKKPVSKKKFYWAIIIAFVSALVIIGLAYYLTRLAAIPNSYYSFSDYDGPAYDTPSPLTGVLTTKEQAERRVIGVMVENSPAARPQSGLAKASLVYEAVAEGGITRFLVFYLEDDANRIGPVRSARAYYLPWVKELDSSYAHVGGSSIALPLIQNYGIKDLDQFSNSQYFWRDSARYAPHNVYSTTKRLREAGNSHDWEDRNQINAWDFQDTEPKSENQISTISVDFSSALFNVEYQYDKKTNSYKRYLAGEPHKDSNDDWIAPKNLLVQAVDQRLSGDGQHMEMDTVGADDAYLFRDGKVFKGEWKKTDLDSRTEFTLESGEEMVFTRGKVWVHVVAGLNSVEYSRE